MDKYRIKFRRIHNSEWNLKDEKVQIKNENRYNLLHDFELQQYSNENKREIPQDQKNNEKIIKSDPHHIDIVETDMLEKIIKAFMDKDNKNNKEKLKEELEIINDMSSKVTNVLSCWFYEAWIDIKIESKENQLIDHQELNI